MRNSLRLGALILASIAAFAQESDRDFSGIWKLDAKRSEIRDPSPAFLRVEQQNRVMRCFAGAQETGPFTEWAYPLDGSETKRQIADTAYSTKTKWEGSALLVNTIVSGPQSYTIMERWTRSRDGSTLKVRRTYVRMRSESESNLVYENPAAVISSKQPENPAPQTLAVRPEPRELPGEFVVDTGTRILLRLVSSVNTKNISAGDKVYLETAYPVFSAGHIIIPPGSYVIGTVNTATRAGRVKGKASLDLRFDSLTLPNGVTRDFRSLPGNVEGRGNIERSEGKIQGESGKGGDARKVGETTAAGASVGSIAGAAAGHVGRGLGIGAAAGAAGGLIGVLSSRGPDVVLPRGTTMEMVLDRPLSYSPKELGLH